MKVDFTRRPALAVVAALLAISPLIAAEESDTARPKILGVAHMAIYVKDLDKTRKFYEDFSATASPSLYPGKVEKEFASPSLRSTISSISRFSTKPIVARVN